MSSGSALLDAKKLLLDAGVTSGMRVADFGAGRAGNIVFAASPLVGEDGIVFAVDVVKDVLAMIDGRRKLFSALNVETVWGDFECEEGVRIPAHTLDMVFIVNNLWCAKNTDSIVCEARRVLKNDGLLVLVDWHRKADHPAAPPLDRRFDALQAEALCLKNGFAKRSDISTGSTHWAIICAQRVFND